MLARGNFRILISIQLRVIIYWKFSLFHSNVRFPLPKKKSNEILLHPPSSVIDVKFIASFPLIHSFGFSGFDSTPTRNISNNFFFVFLFNFRLYRSISKAGSKIEILEHTQAAESGNEKKENFSRFSFKENINSISLASGFDHQ